MLSDAQSIYQPSDLDSNLLADSVNFKKQVFEFQIYHIERNYNEISIDEAGTHPFGDLIAKKIYLFDQSYKEVSVIVPGNPITRTTIRKPAIYEAVNRIEKYLKQSVRDGETSLASAEEKMNKVLDVALNVLMLDTESLESTLGKINTNQERIDLFINRVSFSYL
jgi:hypothetical protein